MAVALENTGLRLTLLQELGARIYDFILKLADWKFLWHNFRQEPRQPMCGQYFGDWRAGG